MSKNLQEFILQFLGRLGEDEVPRLSLKGFREEERRKFPKRWEVVMDQSEMNKAEMRGMKMEPMQWEEFAKMQSTSNLGRSEVDEEVDIEW
jgi:hypothetical protein